MLAPNVKAGGFSTDSEGVLFSIPRVEVSVGFRGEETLAPKLNVGSVGFALFLSESDRTMVTALSVLVRSGRLEPGDLTWVGLSELFFSSSRAKVTVFSGSLDFSSGFLAPISKVNPGLSFCFCFSPVSLPSVNGKPPFSAGLSAGFSTGFSFSTTFTSSGCLISSPKAASSLSNLFLCSFLSCSRSSLLTIRALSRLVLLGVFMISSGVGRTRTGPASTAGVLARLSVRVFSGLPSLDFRLLCRELFLEPLAADRWSGDRNILAFFTFGVAGPSSSSDSESVSWRRRFSMQRDDDRLASSSAFTARDTGPPPLPVETDAEAEVEVWALNPIPGLEWLKTDWFLERREPKDRSVSLFTRCVVVWPTTPEEKSGGISKDRDEPNDEDESRRARLLPVSEISSLDLLFRFPDSSARTAITDLGSVAAFLWP